MRNYTLNHLLKSVIVISILTIVMTSSKNLDLIDSRIGTRVDEQYQLDSVFQALKKNKPKVTFEGNTYFVCEGDLLYSEEELVEYANDILTYEYKSPSLILQTISTLPNIIYSINKSSFDDEQYASIRDSLCQAITNWEETCNVNFQHFQEFDINENIQPGNDGIEFIVKQVNSDGKFLASAFFPDYEYNRKYLLIDESFFSTKITKTGILRHELGHILGFRHEHIRKEASSDCPDENRNGARDLTQYDPSSVMHYFCGEMKNHNLIISNLDSAGSRSIYGPPLERNTKGCAD